MSRGPNHEYNSGLFDGILSTFVFGHTDEDQMWESFSDNHMLETRGYNGILFAIECTDWLDIELKYKLIQACPVKFEITQHMESYGEDYEKEGYNVFSIS